MDKGEHLMKEKKSAKMLRELWYCILPFCFTAFLMMFLFHRNGMYPFGDGSVSWCDMAQQSVPLFGDLKDVLSGRESLFLNMKNAGGMNFWGVFGFFLSSPLNLLVAFVDKERIPQFMNILVTLKLSLCSMTACVYFHYCHRKLSKGECSVLGVIYGLCGYGLMYYQNQMWLDVMYLFPLLMISLELLFRRGRNLPYIILLTMTLYCNFYLSYMVAVYVLVFVGGYLLFLKEQRPVPESSAKLISGTVFAFLISAFVWLPSYVETKQSIRMKSAVETISETHFLSNYETAIPVIYCSAFLFAAVGINVFMGKVRTEQERFSLYLFFMTLLPIFFEPINLTWHTGNYMSFVARYGFATIFSGLRCCAVYLERDADEIKISDKRKNALSMYLTIVFVSAVVYLYIRLNSDYITLHMEELTHYTSTIYGDRTSLDKLSAMFLFAVMCYAAVYLVYKFRLLDREMFVIVLAALVTFESYGNTRVYIASAFEKNVHRSDDFISLMELSKDMPRDESLYRTVTDGKITDYNTIGAMGLNTLGHYTSLTDKEFMYQHKRLGYTSVWVETGTGSSTELSDALYGVRYKISRGDPDERTIAAHNGFRAEEKELYLSPAMEVSRDIFSVKELPEDRSRAGIQQFLFESVFGGEAVTEYLPFENEGLTITQNGVSVSGGTELVYDINVSGRQSLYADCFGNFSNNLAENYFDGLTVTVNDIEIRRSYPTNTDNGFLSLGTFENERVTVKLRARKDLDVGSFGVFGLDLNRLGEAVGRTNCADLTYKRGVIKGSITSDGGSACLLTVPYSKGFTVRVNGKKVSCERVLSDFMAFELESGENDIRISYIPPAFLPSAALSVMGLAGAAVYAVIIRKKKPKLSDRAVKLSQLAVRVTVAAAAFVVYIYPVILNFAYDPNNNVG